MKKSEMRQNILQGQQTEKKNTTNLLNKKSANCLAISTRLPSVNHHESINHYENKPPVILP